MKAWLRRKMRQFRQSVIQKLIHYPEIDPSWGYDQVQLDTERRLAAYLHVAPEEIGNILIVGASLGHEIPRMQRRYPKARFLCFEPSKRSIEALRQRFSNAPSITIRPVGLAEKSGTATLHEMSEFENGSLLKPDPEKFRKLHRDQAQAAETVEISLSTLDEETASMERVDLIWIDVQGAELRVLQGGEKTLTKTEAVFLEIALAGSPYEGCPSFQTLDQFLAARGFTCVALGTDPWNFTGNALWIRGLAARAARG